MEPLLKPPFNEHSSVDINIGFDELGTNYFRYKKYDRVFHKMYGIILEMCADHMEISPACLHYCVWILEEGLLAYKNQ